VKHGRACGPLDASKLYALMESALSTSGGRSVGADNAGPWLVLSDQKTDRGVEAIEVDRGLLAARSNAFAIDRERGGRLRYQPRDGRNGPPILGS
jgi:hypothetical protein